MASVQDYKFAVCQRVKVTYPSGRTKGGTVESLGRVGVRNFADVRVDGVATLRRYWENELEAEGGK